MKGKSLNMIDKELVKHKVTSLGVSELSSERLNTRGLLRLSHKVKRNFTRDEFNPIYSQSSEGQEYKI
jgi:hypothetical protein